LSVAFDVCGDLGISGINDVRYLPDGGAVVAGLEGAVAKLIDPVKGDEVRTFYGHTGAVNAVALSGDGTTLATASDDHTVRLFSVSDAAPLATLTAGDRELLSVAITADASRIVAGAADGQIYLWTRDGAAPAASSAGHSNEVLGIGFAAAEARVFSASKDGSVRLWSATDLSPLGAPVTNATWQTSLAVSPQGDRVAVGDVYGTVKFIGASSGSVEHSVQVGSGRVFGLDFVPDGTSVLASIEDVYSVPVDGSTPKAIAGPIGAPPRAAASPTDDAVFVASQWIMEYVTRSGTPLRDAIHEGPFAVGVAFTRTGDRVAIGGDFGLVVRAAPSGEWLATPDFDQAVPRFEGLGFSPDGAQLVTGDNNGHVMLWATSTWQSTSDIDTGSRGVHSALFSRDGTRFIVAGYDGVNDVYDTTGPTLVRALSFIGQDNHKAAFSPDGSLAAVGTDGGDLALVRTSDWGEVLHVTHAHDSAVDVAFTPDGRLFTTGDHRISLWPNDGSTTRADVADDATFDGRTVEVSADGTLLVAGSNSGEIAVFALLNATPAGDAGAGQGGAARTEPPPPPVRVASLPAHASPVLGTSFAPDSRTLAVAYGDGTVWLWCRK
jgi:WD40 repeat protein